MTLDDIFDYNPLKGCTLYIKVSPAAIGVAITVTHLS